VPGRQGRVGAYGREGERGDGRRVTITPPPVPVAQVRRDQSAFSIAPVVQTHRVLTQSERRCRRSAVGSRRRQPVANQPLAVTAEIRLVTRCALAADQRRLPVLERARHGDPLAGKILARTAGVDRFRSATYCESRRWMPPPAMSNATGSHGWAIASSTRSCTSWPSRKSAAQPPSKTSTANAPKARVTKKPCAP
jgi:hypothetical protein